MEAIVHSFLAWIHSIVEKIAENPIRNIIVLFVSLACAYAIGQWLFAAYGIITLLGYVSSYVEGITRTVDEPRLAIVWGVGFGIGEVVSELIATSIIPTIKQGTAASIIAALFIIYVVASLYMRAEELKSA